MSYDSKDLPGGPDFKFARVRHGYSPEEVDTVIDAQKHKIEALTRQNNDLINESSRISRSLSECNVKIRQLAQSTQMMEQERQKEKLRLADVLTTAGRTAEETVSDARRKAAEIVADAKLLAGQLLQKAEANSKAAHDELTSLAQIMRTARDSSIKHYDRLDAVLHGAVDLLDIRENPLPEQHVKPDFVSAVPDQTTDTVAHEKDGESVDSGDSGQDPYADFIKTMGLSANRAKIHGNTNGKIIGRFGD